MTPDTSAELRHRLLAALTADGTVTDPTVRRAGETVPRESFLGPAIYRPTTNARGVTVWTPTRRADTPPDEWLHLTYENSTHVTQVDGVLAEDASEPITGGAPTSSSTLPGVVLWMIERAGVTKGKRVLVIGAGTGLSTAYVCEIAGAENVTAVETDRAAADRARAALTRTGYTPNLITADGLNGYPPGAPYDVVLAFCSMRHVPYTLLRQLRPGGTLLVTIAGWGFGHGLVLLTAGESAHEASGRFVPGYTSFMMARPHRAPDRGPFELLPGHRRRTRIDPALLDDWTGMFVAQLAAPSAERFGAGGTHTLIDSATGSQARTEPGPDGDEWTVTQRGPLRLWDAVEDAVTIWQDQGAPHLSEFGLTITPQAQRVWLGIPGGPSWNLPI
ncbi:ATP-grasp peptide maturase system methyltransferase [Streptomyces sp. BI20]|uniref:ATP-grasp peptide maturase system methyltransferase n=1 Tax=Streptomyces sp. BI20 TaxID=3403460 RepID=UPI003C7401EC